LFSKSIDIHVIATVNFLDEITILLTAVFSMHRPA